MLATSARARAPAKRTSAARRGGGFWGLRGECCAHAGEQGGGRCDGRGRDGGESVVETDQTREGRGNTTRASDQTDGAMLPHTITATAVVRRMRTARAARPSLLTLTSSALPPHPYLLSPPRCSVLGRVVVSFCVDTAAPRRAAGRGASSSSSHPRSLAPPCRPRGGAAASAANACMPAGPGGDYWRLDTGRAAVHSRDARQRALARAAPPRRGNRSSRGQNLAVEWSDSRRGVVRLSPCHNDESPTVALPPPPTAE